MSDNRNRNRCGFMGEVYWGSLNYNERLYQAYMNEVMQLAMTRFEWRGLPPTVDQIWLERTLIYEGVATIARPRRGTKHGFWYAAKVATEGPPNI